MYSNMYSKCIVSDEIFVMTTLMALYFMCNLLTIMLVYIGEVTSPNVREMSLIAQTLLFIALFYFGTIMIVVYMLLQIWYTVVDRVPIQRILCQSQINECAICLNGYSKYLQMVRLQCTHRFCRKCYKSIISMGVEEKCPLCRRSIDTIYRVLVY